MGRNGQGKGDQPPFSANSGLPLVLLVRMLRMLYVCYSVYPGRKLQTDNAGRRRISQ